MTSILVLLSEGWDRAQTLPTAMLTPTYQMVKKHLQKELTGVPPLQHLPLKPADLKRELPTLYAELFKTEGPAACPFAAQKVEFVASQIRCRGGRAGSSAAAPPGLMQRQASMPCMQQLQTPMDNMASFLMQSMCMAMQGNMRPGGLQLQQASRSLPRLLDVPRRGASVHPALRDHEPAQLEELAEDAASAVAPGTPAGGGMTLLSTEGAIVESGAAADLMPVESPEPEPPKKKKLKPAKVTGHAALAIVLDTMDKRSAAKKVEEASPAAGTKVMKKPGMAAAQKVLKKPAAAGTKVMKKPHFAVEWSRHQVMCRSGREGAGESFALKFAEHGGIEKAVRPSCTAISNLHGSARD